MTKTLTITEATADDLLKAATADGAYSLSPTTRAALIAVLAPTPITPPPGPQSVPGFEHVMWVEWPNDSVKLPPINTVDRGGWKPGSVLVIAFTPTRNGSASIAPWPNDGDFQQQQVALSTKPGDFSVPFPYLRHGQNVGIQWQVGGLSRVNCILQAGTRYYLSYTWDKFDMRVQV